MTTRSDIRRSSIAGTWYPGDPSSLRAMLDGFMANVPAQPLDGDLCALIAPHAGYAYSGQTAAHSYQHIVGKSYDAVIVVGPSHRTWVGDFVVSAESAYETTLGRVPLAEELIDALDQLIPVKRVRENQEHSIEMQLPLLQHALGAFACVPILMSADELAPCERLGRALAKVMRERNILLVASSDLNHISSYAEVTRRDADVIAAIVRFDLNTMADVLLDPLYTVCGRAPILTVCAVAQAMGATRVQVLQHTNSGDVTGQMGEGMYTVGYLSAVFVK